MAKKKKTLKRNGSQRRPLIPSRIKKIIEGSGGLTVEMARRLGCPYSSLWDALHRREGEGWDEVRALIEVERETVVDEAEETMREMMRQRIDFPTARASSQFFLSSSKRGRGRGYGDKKELTLEGGKNPIKVENHVPLDDLDLPLEVRKAVLAAMEAKEAGEKAE